METAWRTHAVSFDSQEFLLPMNFANIDWVITTMYDVISAPPGSLEIGLFFALCTTPQRA